MHVVGEQGDYLNIDSHGAVLWLDNREGYRPFRRVETTPEMQALSQAPAVDNCFQIGWDCGPDQRSRERGYEAYKRSECQLRADNCRYLGWHCQTDDDWTRGYHKIHLGWGCDASGQAQVSTPPKTRTMSVDASSANAVRETFPSNLRRNYSLQSGILTTVAAGTTLSVAGSREYWLKIDWGGSEAWQACWAPMTRVQDEPLDIPDGVDNSCSVNRDCLTDEDWARGYAAYHYNRCGLSPKKVQYHGIKIEGAEGFVYLVERAPNLLQERVPTWHACATEALYRVRQEPASPSSHILIDSGTFFRASIVYSRDDVVYGLVEDMVGSLAHEACHVHQWRDGTAATGWRNEIGCLQAQLAAVEADRRAEQLAETTHRQYRGPGLLVVGGLETCVHNAALPKRGTALGFQDGKTHLRLRAVMPLIKPKTRQAIIAYSGRAPGSNRCRTWASKA